MKTIKILLTILIITSIFLILYVRSVYNLSTPKDSLDDFNSSYIPKVISTFKQKIEFNKFGLKENEYVIFIYTPMLVDSLDWICIHNFINNKTSFAGFKPIFNEEKREYDNISFWNITIDSKDYTNLINFNYFKLLHAYSYMPSIVDGVAYYIQYKNRQMVFWNPSCGISPFDILLSKVILRRSTESKMPKD